MLKNKLFKGFAALALIIGVLSALIGTRIIKAHVFQEAQRRVRLDLNSAWSIYDKQLQKLETTIRMAASKRIFVETLAGDTAKSEEAFARLQRIFRDFDLDFLTLVTREGKVVLRAAPPHRTGDIRLSDPAIARALKGNVAVGTTLYSGERLRREAEGMSEQAFISFEETPRARPTPKTEESRGMTMIAAAPIMEGARTVGALYGGVLLNRDKKVVDEIKSTIYEDDTFNGAPLGTATIFLSDLRVATTVLRANGNRAIGTRVSKEVADRVLDNAMPWVDRAFVVKDWYLTAYDPIRDLDGSVIGMLYVGILEAPFRALAREIVIRYAVLLAFSLAAALVLAFILAGRISQPIHLLSEAAEKMKHGQGYEPLRCDGACEETEHLIETFNEMGATLKEREERLRVANEDLKSLNRSYMDMLGFVSHELKSPVSSIMNYAFLMNTRKIGELNEKQGRAAATIESNIRRISEMIRHYLNLSRIENAEFDPVLTDVKIREEVLDPLLQSVAADVEERNIRIENRVGPDLVVRADLNMMREAFENLVTNAIKYGRDAGRVSIGVKTGEDAVLFAVGNEGEGIPADKIDTLFHKFSRVNGGGAARQKGTGLGLFITRHIVEAHGGTIEVESTPGTWTEFRFTLPLREIKETS